MGLTNIPQKLNFQSCESNHTIMKNINPVAAGFFLCLCISFTSFSQNDLKPWEKYGLSQTEWKMIQDNKISLDKVQELLQTGISIGEYVQEPWKKVSMTEGDWIEKRRSGFTTYDIELEKKTNNRFSNKDGDSTASSEASSFSSPKNQLISFVLPGAQQLRFKETSKGMIMVGLAIASLAGCIIGSIAQDNFEARPLYCVLLPDMFWSFIDFRITIGRRHK
jgi:hypothetical protein